MRRRFGLIPRDESFFELFEQQAAVLRECVPIVTAMRQTDSVDPHWAMAMQAIEQRADQLTSSLIRKTEQTFITPLDREDILALAVAVDDVFDFIEEFTIKLVDYRLAPDEALQTFFELVSMAVIYVADGLVRLRDLQSLEALRTQMKDCEHRADDLRRSAFSSEGYALSAGCGGRPTDGLISCCGSMRSTPTAILPRLWGWTGPRWNESVAAFTRRAIWRPTSRRVNCRRR